MCSYDMVPRTSGGVTWDETQYPVSNSKRVVEAAARNWRRRGDRANTRLPPEAAE